MATYSVTQATVKKEYDGKYGPMKIARIGLTTEAQAEAVVAEMRMKRDTPLPEVGSTIDGELKQGEYGWEFKRDQPAGGFGGGGSGFSRTKAPEERRSIAMQHAQKCAVTILEVAAAHGEYKPPNAGDVVGQVKTVAAALFAQVMEAEGGQG